VITDEQLHRLIAQHKAGECVIVLGTDFAHAIANGEFDLRGLASERVDRIGRGERTVNVYRDRKFVEGHTATREQARVLVDAGVKPAREDREAMELEDYANEQANP
jgi:hypothetical protein